MTSVEPRSPRITIIGLNYTPEPTGIAPYTAGLAEGMASRQYDVTVLTAHPHYPNWRIPAGFGQWTSRLTEGGVKVVRLRHYVPAKLSNLRRLIAEISFGLRVATHRWNDPDVVVLVSPGLFSSSIAMCRARMRRRTLPVGVWVQDLYSLGLAETGSGSGLLERLVTNAETKLLRSATSVCVIHERFAKHVSTKLGVESRSIQVVRNWTHLTAAPDFDTSAFREKMGWEPHETIVLHAGAQGLKQDLRSVIDCARLAQDEEESIRFVLLGNGGQRTALEDFSKGASQVEFVDPLPGDQFQMAMASADVLLVNERPGLAEMAVPSKLTSYFSTGRPVIAATDLGSVTAGEVDLSGGGIRVDAGDAGALLAGIKSLRDDPDHAGRLGLAGRRFQADILGPERAMEHLQHWIGTLARPGAESVVEVNSIQACTEGPSS